MSVRRAELAGSWYPSDPAALEAEIRRCLDEKAGEPGSADVAERVPVAVAAPHAGLAFSGPTAAAAYRLVRDVVGEAAVFVVFGASHRADLRVPAVWCEGEWETPLGGIAVDSELARRLVEAGAGEENERPHRGDNAIELQTPFIKYLFPEARIVPVAVSPRPDSWMRGRDAARAAASRGGEGPVIAVASTDLTHYGAAFGVTPAGFGEPALAWGRANDARFLDAVLRMDVEGIVAVAERDGSACGAGAVAAAAGWAREIGCSSARLLARTDSHEAMPVGVAEHFVGYASFAWMR